MSNKTLSNPDAATNLIIVMGVSGSGKSTLAQALALHYHYTYLDADDFHSEESRKLMSQGIALTDENRTPWVAALKHRLETAAKNHEHCVLAFSGLKQKHRNELRKAGLRTIVLFLEGTHHTIHNRISEREGHFMPPQLLSSQFDSLENPLDETDVYPIDISSTIGNVIASAQEVVDQYLLF